MTRQGIPDELIREGETILEMNSRTRVGSSSQNFSVFRIGLIKGKERSKYARIKLPDVMWNAMVIEAKMIANGNSIVAVLLREVSSNFSHDDAFSVRQPNDSRKDKPYIDIPVGNDSKMRGNRYPKDASSFIQEGWIRVDIPGSVDLKRQR